MNKAHEDISFYAWQSYKFVGTMMPLFAAMQGPLVYYSELKYLYLK